MVRIKKMTVWSKAQAKQRVPVLKLTVLQITALLVVIAVGSFTVYALNNNKTLPKNSGNNSNSTSATKSASAPQPSPQLVNSNTVAANQPAVVSQPVNYCSTSSAVTLTQTYKNIDAAYVTTITTLLARTDLSYAQEVNTFNQDVLGVNGQYIDAYAAYQAAQKAAGCPVAVSPRPLLPICNPPTIDFLSLENCIANTHLAD